MPAPLDPLVAPSQLAYEQASAALARQHESLEALRGRAVALLTAATVVASLFSGWVLSNRALGLLGWLAIAAFVLVACVCLFAAAPHVQLERGIKPSVLLAAVDRDQGLREPGAAHRAVALHLEASYGRNNTVLARIATTLQIAVSIQAVAVLCWVAELVLIS
ncbi:hypothetical protein VSS74_29215 [Conexibacter stalactiti]|uniref:Integral membrane plasmid transfer protein n=1 Tax=Conexibacter stalactiti TaxID=1940611 RepID=A0ABU4HYS3_9ACTN|nr:hypothetical protein [Conexibacter stalactiti]MDW5598476.1 hypothetical protein [Conexibacter stalactiti]MEC5039118.1 hypothetical protein [Conexibacter stalactiti]